MGVRPTVKTLLRAAWRLRRAAGRLMHAPLPSLESRPSGATLFRWIGAALIPLLISGAAVTGFSAATDALFDPGSYSLVVQDRNGETLRVYLNKDEQWILPPDAAEPPQKLAVAVTTFEDKRFYGHLGVDPLAIARALYQNVTGRRRVSGASTITMQLARIAGGRPRTIPSKVVEIAHAVVIELRYSKAEILRLYLDHAPYGGNVVGYQTAAHAYFGKTAGTLSWAEAATLAVLPNAPGLVSPAAEPARLRARRDALLETLAARGHLSAEQYSAALEEPVPTARIPFPVLAPHLADRARRETGRRSGAIATTVDAELQRILEENVAFHSRYLNSEGVKNLSALVIETETGAVRAYAGSQDYFDIQNHGQIDGITSPRSTGSLLKPFLYARAIDQGMITTESVLEDVPESYGAFSPRNADSRFRGLVTAREALVQSLNVPAADLLQEYGLVYFHHFLTDAGLTHLFRTPEDYGLPLILGGAEATPWEMAGMFRGLGTYGTYAPPHYLPGGTEGNSGATRTGLVSAGASYLVLDMLKDVRRPGAEAYWASFRDKYPIAWKTGTSYGQRDAWAVGVSPKWTIVVWTGNFTGEENANLRSTTSAGILLFDVFNALPKEDADPWFSPEPQTLRTEEVCLATGYRATAACPDTRYVEVPAHSGPLKPCPYHRHIYVTNDERFRVDAGSWEPGNYKRVSRLFYPVDVVQYLRDNGTIVERIPPYAPGFASAASDDIEVTYPDNGASLFVPRDLTGELQRVTLRVAHRRPDVRVFWYLNGTYLGETRRKHVMVPPLDEGDHRLVVVDQYGTRAATSFTVARSQR